jgi:hypothetical protein
MTENQVAAPDGVRVDSVLFKQGDAVLKLI